MEEVAEIEYDLDDLNVIENFEEEDLNEKYYFDLNEEYYLDIGLMF